MENQTKNLIGRFMIVEGVFMTFLHSLIQGHLDPATANAFDIFRALYYGMVTTYMCIFKYPNEKTAWTFGLLWGVFSLSAITEIMGW